VAKIGDPRLNFPVGSGIGGRKEGGDAGKGWGWGERGGVGVGGGVGVMWRGSGDKKLGGRGVGGVRGRVGRGGGWIVGVRGGRGEGVSGVKVVREWGDGWGERIPLHVRHGPNEYRIRSPM